MQCIRKLVPFLLLAAAPCPSQRGFELTIDSIMRGPELYGYAPRAVRWSEDGRQVYFEWKRATDPRRADFDTYVVNRDGSGLRKLTDEQAREAPPAAGHRSRDRARIAYTRDGDVFVYDHGKGAAVRLTRTIEEEADARFTGDERGVAYRRGDNLYVYWLDTGLTEQMTHILPEGSPPDPREAAARKKGTDSQEFLRKEESDLLETVREREAKRGQDNQKSLKLNPRKSHALARRQKIASLGLSPDGAWVVASVEETPEEAKQAIVPAFVTTNAYTDTRDTRTKVGDLQPRLRLGVISAGTGEWRWVEHGIKQGDQDRAIQLSAPVWSEQGSRAVVEGESADNKDRWIFALDPVQATLRPLVHIHDDAWVGGPGSSGVHWLPDDDRIAFVWERDGWAHLYTVSYQGGQSRQLTSGAWEVRDVAIAGDRSKFFLTTSEADPGEDHLYSMAFDGGPRSRLTTRAGSHNVVVSPDGAALADVYSYTNQPPELYIGETRVTDSPLAEFRDYPWLDVPIVEIPARDSVPVRARIYKPAGYADRGPAVIFVHGAGYLQNVHHRWSSYSREYLFHHFLMAHGYLVLDIDYRGSAGYGRDWRTAIYRHMGGTDLDDHIDAARWLASRHGVDPARIGIYGGSYGGFITLMAMFTQPGVFQAGAALRPVTDWAHYNHPYTSNILNTPPADPEAFRRSSPIYFAEGLRGALLLSHGMVDVNVHFQDTVRLAQRLIELRKENWELAAYPVEDHAFSEPSSWADQYKRIFKLFEANLK